MVSPDAPLRTPNFYGRQDQLKQMFKYLSRSGSRKIVVLWGLGSFGKTQLALQFQSLHYDRNVSRIWIDVKALNSFSIFKDITIDVLEYEQAPTVTSIKDCWSLGTGIQAPTVSGKGTTRERIKQ
jgi:GTPase SAR1 family protein